MNYQIYVDLGMSGTKVSFCDGVTFQSYLCPPRVADLPPSELQILQDQGNVTPGSYVNIAAHKKHRVDWTDPAQETIWLAVFY